MNWDDLKYFLHVARSGSLTGAATALKVSQSTISRRITELEASLNTRLFERYQTGYFLTDEGQQILHRALAAEEEMAAVERAAAGMTSQAFGSVRLATSDNLATDLIIPALPALRARHPHIELHIIANTSPVTLGQQEADLALRVIRPASGNLKIRQLGQMSYAVYASRDYLQKHPQSADDPFAGRAIITWDEANSHLPAARWLGENALQGEVVLRASNLPMQISAVRAGLGLAVLPDFLATDSRLVKVVPSEQLFNNGLWLVIHADLSASSRVRAVADFLAQTVAEHPALRLAP